MFKNFLRDSINFSFANIFIKALNIILIPIYVRLLTFEDYGIFELLTTLTIILVVVISLEVNQSILRFVADTSDNSCDNNAYIRTGLHIILVSSVIFILLVYHFAPSISNLLFKTHIYSKIIQISSWIISFQSLNYSISVIYRAEKNFFYAIRHSIVTALSTGSLSLLLLVNSSGSLESLLLGQAMGGLLAFLFGIFYLHNKLSFTFDINIAKRMLVFSVPLVFSGVALHLSSFADRIIINELLSLESLATYGIAAKAASIITILISGLGATLSPHFISTWNSSAGKQNLAKIFLIYLFISVLLLIFLYIFGKFIIIFLGTSAAIGGKKVLIILASSSIISGLNIFLFGLIKAMKTKLLAIIYSFTAILNVYLNYILINSNGIEGAASATLISTSVGFLIHYYLSSNYIKLPFSFFIPFCFIMFLIFINGLILFYT